VTITVAAFVLGKSALLAELQPFVDRCSLEPLICNAGGKAMFFCSLPGKRGAQLARSRFCASALLRLWWATGRGSSLASVVDNEPGRALLTCALARTGN
jgi:hypothetical protein